MTVIEAMARTMVCPYCGYTCQSRGIGAVYCGPHYASFGGNTFPAVRMLEKPTAIRKETRDGE